MCALARTTTTTATQENPSFILMGADICHHAAEFRPSPYAPLPMAIRPNPLSPRSPGPCPGALFADIHHDRSDCATSPFFVVPDLPPERGIAHDRAQAIESIRRLEEFDCQGAGEGADGGGEVDVFTVIAHDASLMGVVGLYPESANGWREKGWAREGRWAFLGDFREAVREGGGELGNGGEESKGRG